MTETIARRTDAPEPVEPDGLPPLAPPTAGNGLYAVFHRRYMLKLLVRREISARYQGSFLGLMWSYINPLSQFLIYWLVLGQVLNLHQDIQNFAVHIFSALIIVHFFTDTLSSGTRSIMRNRSIVQRMAMPRELFPVASLLVSLYHVIPQLVIMLVVCALSGYVLDPGAVVALVMGLALMGLLGLSFSLLFAAANVFFRDVQSVLNILTHLIRFGVPMIYSYDMVDQRFGSAAQYYLLNPIADAVLLFQRAFWVGTTDNPAATARDQLPDHLLLRGGIMVVFALVLLAFGQWVFSRLENKIPERL